MAKVTGIVFVRVNGKLLRSKEGASVELGGKERTSIVGHSHYGYSEKVRPSVVECTIVHTADTNLQELADITEATVEFETDTGVAYVIAGAYLTEPPKLTGGEGEVTLKFEGPPAIEA